MSKEAMALRRDSSPIAREPSWPAGMLVAFVAMGVAGCGGGTSSALAPVSASAPSPTPSPAPAPTVAGVILSFPITRDPLKWPFAATSIWNTPIGAGAVYVPAQLSAYPGTQWIPMPQVDEDIIVLRPQAPPTNVVQSTIGWTGGDRCSATNPTPLILQQVPIPNDFLVPNSSANNAAAFLASDGRTLLQSQPFTRCTAGQAATAFAAAASADLYGDGATGAHGGSGLSAIGGTLRIGELRPGAQPPRHALKIDIDTRTFLHPCTRIADCYRWPAITADSDALTSYGSTSSSSVPAGMKMGALLAIPEDVDLTSLGLETAPGQMLAWTLQNYGAYVVDSTGGAGFSIAAETGPDGSVRTQFLADWGYPLQDWALHASVGATTNPWVRDMQRLVVRLNVVDNNLPYTPGGGGALLQPPAPTLTAPD